MKLPEGVELVQTCGACPEQYDMLIYGENVAYFRLRHSSYTVEHGSDLVLDGVRPSLPW